MAQINPYLIFNGNCEAAFTFYKSVFGGEFPYMGKFKDMPQADGSQVNDADADRVMHVSLPISNETILMGSDATSQSGEVTFGDNISVSVNTGSEAEARRIFESLAVGGIIKMPIDKTFWGALFGMCTDQFGINWMVNYDYPKE
jgi:PhnB protein